VLELYHNINSVCAQKVRIALNEKGQDAKKHILTLRGDQNEPAYLKLNPNGVVPTLIHDRQPIVESSLILYYIDDIAPGLENAIAAVWDGVPVQRCTVHKHRNLWRMRPNACTRRLLPITTT
jgi:glutathione S-transferase